MHLTKINQVLEALRARSIPAERSFPGTRQPRLQVPEARVGLQEQTRERLQLSVDIFCPGSLGGSLCEDTGASALEALSALGAQCRLGPCSFDRTADLFRMTLSVTWSLTAAEAAALDCSVSINGTALPYLTGFSCRESAQLLQVKALGRGTRDVRREDIHWILTVEELLPASLAPTAPESFDFTLMLTRSGGTETYTLCNWERILRQETPQGIRQIRTARSWGERRLNNG